MEPEDTALVEKAAKIYRVLGNPNRLKIIFFLRHFPNGQEVNAIVAATGLNQPLVSRQLAMMKQVGIVTSSKRGLFITYQLSDMHIVNAVIALIEHVQHQ